MTIICNDQLTRVRVPSYGKNWTVPREPIRVGDKGDKNGMPYTVKAFGASLYRKMGKVRFPANVWMIVKYKGCKRHAWDCLLLGDTTCFEERLVFGGPHPNPIFTHYWPKGEPQPL